MLCHKSTPYEYLDYCIRFIFLEGIAADSFLHTQESQLSTRYVFFFYAIFVTNIVSCKRMDRHHFCRKPIFIIVEFNLNRVTLTNRGKPFDEYDTDSLNFSSGDELDIIPIFIVNIFSVSVLRFDYWLSYTTWLSKL